MNRRHARTGGLTAAAAATALLMSACGGTDAETDPAAAPAPGAAEAVDTPEGGTTETDTTDTDTTSDEDAAADEPESANPADTDTDTDTDSDTAEAAGGTESQEPAVTAENGAEESTDAPLQDIDWVDEVMGMDGIYYALDREGGDAPTLVRQLVSTPGSLEEVVEYLNAEPYDPDYRTLVGGWVESVEHEDGEFTVVVDRGAPEGNEAERAMAVQQVVYTLQTTQDASDPVRFITGDGTLLPPSDLGGQENPAGASTQAEALAAINITTPGEDGAVLPGQSTVSGRAWSADDVIRVRVVDPEDPQNVPIEQSVELQAGPPETLVPWATELDVSALDPGEWEVVALTVDTDGESIVDTKTIQVEDAPG